MRSLLNFLQWDSIGSSALKNNRENKRHESHFLLSMEAHLRIMKWRQQWSRKVVGEERMFIRTLVSSHLIKKYNQSNTCNICLHFFFLFLECSSTWACNFSVSLTKNSTKEPLKPSMEKALGSYVSPLKQYWALSKRLKIMLSSWEINECLIASKVKFSLMSTLSFGDGLQYRNKTL